MEKLLFFFKKVILPACLYFTLLCFAFSAILTLAGTEMTLPTIDLTNITQMFVFSLIFSASNLLFENKKIKYGVSLLLHFLCFIGNVSVVFFFIGKHYTSAKNALSVLFVFALIYIFIATVFSVIRHFVNSDKNEKKAYKRLY